MTLKGGALPPPPPPLPPPASSPAKAGAYSAPLHAMISRGPPGAPVAAARLHTSEAKAVPPSATTVPPPGSPAAAWKQCFAALGLNNTDLAVLGPDVIGSDPAAAEALLASDPELAPTVATISKLMNAPGRTGYELAYAKAVNKLASLGRRDERRYLFAIMRPDVAKLAQKLVVGG